MELTLVELEYTLYSYFHGNSTQLLFEWLNDVEWLHWKNWLENLVFQISDFLQILHDFSETSSETWKLHEYTEPFAPSHCHSRNCWLCLV
jgi:hypothetical protein